jgi:flagellar hook-associated protein 2
VLSRITNSAAGVSANYDTLNNRFVLTNKTTGDTGITIKDVTGNLLLATGLSGGSLQHGKNLLYTVNNGSQLVSQSNTITDSSSGITGLSVTALTAQKAVSVTVSSDTSTISSAIQKFITDYNTVQTYITSQTSVTTASDGTVTAGLLTGDQTTNEIASSLRSISSSPVSIPGLTSVVNQLADLGIQSNGQDNTIQLSDTGALNTALTANLSDVKALFSDSTYGLGTQLNNFINGLIGDNGSLAAHQATLTQRSTDIGTQISNLEKTVTDDSARWATEFQAMEQAQAQVNQELTYLSQQVTNWAKS